MPLWDLGVPVGTGDNVSLLQVVRMNLPLPSEPQLPWGTWV